MRALAFVVFRYLLGLSRRTHVAVVSAISFVSLALGAAALVLTLGLLEGFQGTVREELRKSGPHALLVPASGDKLPSGDWLSQLATRHPGFSFRKLERGVGWLLALGEAIPVQVEVVDGLSQVEVDRVLAAKGAIGPGAEVDLLSPAPVLTPLGPVPRQFRVRVARVVASPARAERGTVRVPRDLGRQLFPQGGREEVQVTVPAGQDPLVASQQLAPVPPGVVLRPFRELNRPLLAALSLEKLLIGLGVSLIVLVASLNLLCNLTMLAAEKRADAAILQAMGLAPQGVARLFQGLGLAIGVGAGVVGSLGGALLAEVLHRTQAIPLPRGVFAVSHVPFAVRPEHLGVVLAVTFLASFFASQFPARAAARRSVLEGLRRE